MKVELEQAAAERGQAEIIHRNLKERNTILEKRYKCASKRNYLK
jgi:hypothetical protein